MMTISWRLSAIIGACHLLRFTARPLLAIVRGSLDLLGLLDSFGVLSAPNTHGHHLVLRERRVMNLTSMPALRRPLRSTVSVKVDAEIAARFRELCLHYSGLPHFLRQNEVVEQCLRQFITEFERKLAEGDAAKTSDQSPPARNSTRH